MSGINRIIKQTDHQYTMVPNQAVRDPEITSNAFRLLAYLLSHENGYELVYSQIIRQTDLGKYAIQKGIQLLTEKGLLRVEETRRQDGSFGGYNYYLLDPYKYTGANEPGSGQSVTDSFHHGTTSPLKEDNSLEKITNKEEHSKNGDAFEQFWKAYPRGEGKAQAHKAYLKAIKKISHDELMKALETYKAYNSRQGIIFAHASSWLNGERWEDEYEATYSTEVREKSLDSSRAYLEELRQLEQQAAPPPKCEHGNTLARCPICLAS